MSSMGQGTNTKLMWFFLNADIYYNLSLCICVRKTTCRLFIYTISISAHAVMLNKANKGKFNMPVSLPTYIKMVGVQAMFQ